MYAKRPPIDLANPRLRRLAAALGPAYVRVTGTWANRVYFHDAETPPPTAPPPGFQSVLTRRQWAGVVEFARAVDAKLVTSFALSAGVRDRAGVWTPAQARLLVAFTRSPGGEIAAAELFNEPTFAAMGGAPPGYDAELRARLRRIPPLRTPRRAGDDDPWARVGWRRHLARTGRAAHD